MRKQLRDALVERAARPDLVFLTGDLDNPERDKAGLAKLQALGVPTQQTILKNAKHGCWMQEPWFELCVAAADAWFREYLK